MSPPHGSRQGDVSVVDARAALSDRKRRGFKVTVRLPWQSQMPLRKRANIGMHLINWVQVNEVLSVRAKVWWHGACRTRVASTALTLVVCGERASDSMRTEDLTGSLFPTFPYIGCLLPLVRVLPFFRPIVERNRLASTRQRSAQLFGRDARVWRPPFYGVWVRRLFVCTWNLSRRRCDRCAGRGPPAPCLGQLAERLGFCA